HPRVAALRVQVAHARAGALPGARSVHSVDETEEHVALDDGRRSDHAPRRGILRLRLAQAHRRGRLTGHGSMKPRIDGSLLAIVGEGLLSRLSFGLISFALPLYARHLGLSLSEVGMLVAINSAVAVALKPLLGWVADRFGLKRTLVAAISLRSLVSLLLGFASAPWEQIGRAHV